MFKILIADDSMFVREQLRQLLLCHGDFLVVGEAHHGKEAVEMTRRLHPDVIIMDVDMPVMDGIDATRQIMEEVPTPILIHTSSYISRSRNVPFEAIKMGAIDIIEKPKMYPLDPSHEKEFINRIKLISGIKVFRRLKVKSERRLGDHDADLTRQSHSRLPQILAVAASTGGPKALFDLFSLLPPILSFPIVLVQHIGNSFVSGFMEWLQNTSQVQMKIAEHGETLIPNVCYISPGGLHLAVRSSHQIELSDIPPVHSCKPSADVLFNSVSAVYGDNAVGVLLTGIGEDGALGLYEMNQAGATTIAQDEESSVVFGMPKRAIEMNAATYIANITQVATHIKRLFHLQ